MGITVATWNINSIRLRKAIVLDLLNQEAPDVLCIQEAKSPVEKIPADVFAEAGYPHMVARGHKGYNGVVTLARVPLEDAGSHPFCGNEDARHVAARLPNGVVVNNFYVPAGGDKPDRDVNPKFGHKLDFLTEMKERFANDRPSQAILVGDLNIAPREDDVWSHRQLLKVVSHTPVETELLEDVRAAGDWVDVTRKDIPDGQLYSWWSYRSPDWDNSDKGRRLDHIWATPDLAGKAHSSRILRHVRGWDQPSDHAPVFATFDV